MLISKGVYIDIEDCSLSLRKIKKRMMLYFKICGGYSVVFVVGNSQTT